MLIDNVRTGVVILMEEKTKASGFSPSVRYVEKMRGREEESEVDLLGKRINNC